MDDVIFAGTAHAAGARFRRSLAARRARDGDERRCRRAWARSRSRAGSSAAPAPPIASTAATCAPKDVALLFADAATGAHSPALVSQGKIGAVIAAKPAERRLMLEEAAGIAGLHVRRKDAEQKLRATEANLVRLDEIDRRAWSCAASALRRQARAAERYRKLSDQIRVAEARLIFARWREAAAAADAARAEARGGRGSGRRGRRGAARRGRVSERRRRRGSPTRASAAQAARERATRARPPARRAARRARRRRAGASPSSTSSRAPLAADRAREDALADGRRRRAGAAGRGTGGDRGAARRCGKPARRRSTCAPSRPKARRATPRSRWPGAAPSRRRSRPKRGSPRPRWRRRAAQAARAPRPKRRGSPSRSQALGGDADLIATLARGARRARERRRSRAGRGGAGDRRRRSAAPARRPRRATPPRARPPPRGPRSPRCNREARALVKAVEAAGQRPRDRPGPAAPGYERALAAALGDDLEAGARRRRRAALGRRRAAARRSGAARGVRAARRSCRGAGRAARAGSRRSASPRATTASALAVGQRLVTLDGALRRWDGYVATGAARRRPSG